MEAFPTSLEPLAGGHSGETFLATVAGETVVARIYGPRSAWRGPTAPEVDAAVLDLVRGILPVAEVLEARPGDPEAGVPGLLLTSRLPGEPLDRLLPQLDDEALALVGRQLGTLLGRLRHMVQPRPGMYANRRLLLVSLPDGAEDVTVWVDDHAEGLREAGWDDERLDGLAEVAEEAQDLLDLERRSCLVHGDLNPKNLLVDPGTLRLTGVVDWEFAHAGSPYADLGNLLRFDRQPAYVESVLAAHRELVPGVPDDVLDRARAADLFALVELAARRTPNAVVEAARELLGRIADSGDLHGLDACGRGPID